MFIYSLFTLVFCNAIFNAMSIQIRLIMFKIGGNVARYSITGSAKKKTNIHNSEELIQKIWESVRSNNGIMVCLRIIMS